MDKIIKQEKKGWFYSYNIIFELSLSEHAKLIYLYLCRCADNESQSFPSYNDMAKKCSVSQKTAIRAIKELETHGLIHHKQRTISRGEKLSLTSNLYTIFDQPTKQISDKKKEPEEAPKASPFSEYEQIIKNNIAYEQLLERPDRDIVEDLYNTLLDVVSTTKKTIKVNGEDKPSNVVKSVFLNLNQLHIEYVLETLRSNTTKIKNIRAYLITTLYNSPSTINSYYKNGVNHTLYRD